MHPLPEPFVRQIGKLLGKEETALFTEALQSDPVISIRINPMKVFTELPGIIQDAQPVGWCAEGYYLNKRPSFTFDPCFHAGAYYVQEASSMFLGEVIKQHIPLNEDLLALDLCAAPGGKSTHIASLLSKDSILVSNEVIASRVNVLAENLQRWGRSNVIVTNNDPEQFHQLDRCFDLVVIDAPCSGEGMFRKDPHAIDEWSPAHVELCSARQKRIIEHATALVKPGGYLIYSTCTFEEQENEEIVQAICNEYGFQSKKIITDHSWNIEETTTKTNTGEAFGYRFYPHRVKGEGFFISCLQKDEGTEEKLPKVKKNIDKLNAKSVSLLDKWIKDTRSLHFILFKENILAVGKPVAEKMYSLLNSSLKIKSFGTEIGQLFKDDLAPSHHLAMSELIRDDLPSIELNYEDAISYLQKKDFKISSENKGWHLMKYEGYHLGWGKILPNRMNNYYPTEWRIRKS